MKKVKIDNKFNEMLNCDPIAETEKVLNKHHSEFNRDEGLLMLANALHTNEIKANYLKSLGDTHFSISWDEFINIIESYGFKEGLRYDFQHDNGKCTDEAALYYYPEKGLVIWATSYWNKKSLNSGKLYGQVKSKEKIEYETVSDKWGERQIIKWTGTLKSSSQSLNDCSHGAFMDIETGIDFDYDVREALINKIEQIGNHLEFLSKWNKKQFLWFLDYAEEKQPDYDYKEITKEKIMKCPKELQEILAVCI
ncbi:hypothetical protein COE51_01390 [Bacillus pseudomycoides]|nr:hypothetical protein COE51_01390 [Bacillus pseudomycoides]